MLIRPIAESDTDEWLRMRRLLWPETSDEEHQREMQDYGQDAGCAVFVAEEMEGRLLGFLEAGVRAHASGCESKNVGYLEGWYVEPSFRRRGIGGRLVEEAERWARSKGCTEMASDCDMDNETSLAAHLGLGYREVNRLIHFMKGL
jgi:aminoglycoside 6'-N-acetyltransferase I